MSKRKRREEATHDVIQEIFLNGLSIMFESFIKKVPADEVEDWRAAFDESQRLAVALYAEKREDFGWADVVQRLPENIWVKLLNEMSREGAFANEPMTLEEEERIRLEIRADIDRKMKGKDVH